MLDYAISGVPVVDTQRHVLGVVTEADLMSKEAFSHRHQRPLEVLVELMTGDRRWTNKAAGLTAADAMTTETITVRPDEDIRVAARHMLVRGVKRLLVLDDGELVGIVSRYDLLRVSTGPTLTSPTRSGPSWGAPVSSFAGASSALFCPGAPAH